MTDVPAGALRAQLDFLALHRADYRCQVCNSPHDLRTHARVPRPIHARDLTVLCEPCLEIHTLGGRISGLYTEEDAVT